MLSSLPLANGSPVSAELSPNPDTISVYVALLDTISDSVIFTDLEGRIRFWNTGATRIFGYPPEEMLGRTVAILYPQEDPQRLAQDLARIRAGEDFVGEWRGRRRDGDLDDAPFDRIRARYSQRSHRQELRASDPGAGRLKSRLRDVVHARCPRGRGVSPLGR